MRGHERRAVRTDSVVEVIDDDPAFRGLVRTLLERAGYSVLEAETGEDGLALAQSQQPRLVVLDVRLPGLSGYEVCRELRDTLGEELPIVFVSGDLTDALDRVAGLLLGADEYLVKPFVPDELLARVDRLIEVSRPRVAAAHRLTPRELEVLAYLAEGLDQDEIAAALVVTRKTVAKHLEHVLAKLGVHSRVQAVAHALREGIV